jgi:hypothetical protein
VVADHKSYYLAATSPSLLLPTRRPRAGIVQLLDGALAGQPGRYVTACCGGLWQHNSSRPTDPPRSSPRPVLSQYHGKAVRCPLVLRSCAPALRAKSDQSENRRKCNLITTPADAHLPRQAM